MLFVICNANNTQSKREGSFQASDEAENTLGEKNCGLLLPFCFTISRKQDISHLGHLSRCAPLNRRAQQLDAATLTKTKDSVFTPRDYIS